LAKQGAEACLLEVVIAGQRFDKAALGHDDEGDTVGERSGLVEAAGIEVEATIEKVGVRGENLDTRIRAKQCEESDDWRPPDGTGQSIGHLRQDSRGRYEGTNGCRSQVSLGRLVGPVVPVENGDKEEGVGEQRGHRFGRP
jgi:hypothetical protein